ncbi:hypothetical protein CMK18_21140 [Candidatus Poribacteria bacterium]|nr:hypothetical protein [Candidatus Poribacteria bacterium]
MAGNTRFHNKYHFAQHHSEKTTKNEKYPEATTDPIASEDFPFQGNFHSDGVLKIHSTDPTDFNYLHNNTTIGENLTVEKDTLIKGGLEVVGNVLLRADPFTGNQTIQIGNDQQGGDFDTVKFVAYVDSDFSPDYSDQHSLGDPKHFWKNIYTSNLTLTGEFMLGNCDDEPFRGMYINNKLNKPGGARLGINTCTPEQELHVVGDGLISEDLTVYEDIEGKGNLWIYQNAKIDGVVTLQDENPVRWGNDLIKIRGSGNKLVLDASESIVLNAGEIDISKQSVELTVHDSVRALCVGQGIFGIDGKNRRVGVGTCNPTESLHVEGNVLANSDDIKLKSSDDIRIEADDRVEVVAGSHLQLESDDTMGIFAEESITIASPKIIGIAGDMDWDMSKVDVTTQPVQFILMETSTRSMQFGNCLLNIDGKNKRVGIGTCNPESDLHVEGDVKLNGDDYDATFKNHTTKSDVTILESGKTVIKGGNVGIDVDDPQFKLSIPCGEEIGTHSVQGATTISNRIKFCTGVNNTEGWDNMQIITDGRSDIAFHPGRSVQIPDRGLSIGNPYNGSHPENSLEVRGRTHLLGDLVIESYENNGQGQDRLSLHSYQLADIGTITSRSGILSGGADNNVVIDLDTNPTDSLDIMPGFGIRYNSAAGEKVPGLVYSSYLHSANTVEGFLGINTTDHKFTDITARGGDNIAKETNLNIKGFTVFQDSVWIDEDLHVNNNQVIDGQLSINCLGTDISQDLNGITVKKGSVILTNDTTTNAQMVLDTNVPKSPRAGADDLGSGSITVSNIAGGTAEHLSLDLRNTQNETSFAVRYSSLNDGIADKIGLSMRPYNGVAHVGVGGIPSEGEHLLVNGNTRITGNITIEGPQSNLQTTNLDVEDVHISLNKTNEPNGPQTNDLLESGIWMHGDNDAVVGYVKVHETDLSKLVAKAPTGTRFELDINGTVASTYTSNESSVNITNTTFTADDAVIDIDGDLTVEGTSLVDQDLTRDSTDVKFGDLDITGTLNLPIVQAARNDVADPNLADGYIRYNSQLTTFEASKEGLWMPLDVSNIIKDRDGNTYAEVNDSDVITVAVKDIVQMKFQETGITIPSGDRMLKPALIFKMPFLSTSIETMPVDFQIRGLGAEPSPAPFEATGQEMQDSGIVSGNKYIVIDHRGDEEDVLVQIYTDSGKMIIPDEIHIVNKNRICIDVTSFTNLTGKVMISM